MEEPIYDFTFRYKYRDRSPFVYTASFVLGLVYSIPNLLAGLAFMILHLAGGLDAEYANLAWVAVIFLILFPAAILIFSVWRFNRGINNRYVFYDSSFRVFEKKREYNFKYTDISYINEINGLFFIYLFGNKKFPFDRKCLGNISAEELTGFLNGKRNIHSNNVSADVSSDVTSDGAVIVKAEFRLDRENFLEMMKFIYITRGQILWMLVSYAFAVFLGVGMIRLGNPLAVIMFIIPVISIIRIIAANKSQLNKIENSPPAVTDYYFYEDYFVSDFNGQRQEYDYSRLGKSFETQKHFFLNIGSRRFLTVDKNNFEIGTCEELRNLLERKLPGKFRKHK